VSQKAFDKLKDCICSDPVLRSPDFSKKLILQTDASGKGMGAVLEQEFDDGNVRNSKTEFLKYQTPTQ
jgi:hypothetical protein